MVEPVHGHAHALPACCRRCEPRHWPVPPCAPPKSSIPHDHGRVWPTMAKRGARSMVSWRSRSSLRPAINAWIGAWTASLSAGGASCTSPSVIRMAPAMRSGGTSARAAFRPAKSWCHCPRRRPSVVTRRSSRKAGSFSSESWVADRGNRRVFLRAPVLDPHALRAVDDDRGDIGTGDAGLVHE